MSRTPCPNARRILALAAAFACVGGALAAHAHGPGVTLSEDGPRPAELTISTGESVDFHNETAGVERVQGADDAFRSPELAPGKGWHLRFPFPGRFEYHLEAHPEQRGVIVVKKAAR